MMNKVLITNPFFMVETEMVLACVWLDVYIGTPYTTVHMHFIVMYHQKKRINSMQN